MSPSRNVALEDLQNQPAVSKERTGTRCPAEGQFSVIRLDVATPNLIAIEIVGANQSVAVEENHYLAIGSGRTGGVIAPVVASITGSHLMLPEQLSGIPVVA